jgi:Two component regulator propeller
MIYGSSVWNTIIVCIDLMGPTYIGWKFQKLKSVKNMFKNIPNTLSLMRFIAFTRTAKETYGLAPQFWVPFATMANLLTGLASKTLLNGVRSIAEDKNGNFWFNTAYKYEVYNKNALIQKSRDQNANFYDRIKSIGCLDGKKDGDLNEFLSIIKDDNGNLWIATYLHGVWKYDGDSIEHYPIQVNNKNIPVYCLYQDKKGDIWLGTEKNGVYKFDGMSFERRNSGDF